MKGWRLLIIAAVFLASCAGGGSDDGGWSGEWKLQTALHRNECSCQDLAQPLTLSVSQSGNEFTACDTARCIGLFWFKGQAGADSIEAGAEPFAIQSLCAAKWDSAKATLRISSSAAGGFEGEITVLGSKSNSAETCLTEYKGAAVRE
jgi:hypothetical protein